MNSHKTKIIETKKVGDGYVAALIQCCEHPEHTSWINLHASVAADDVRRNAEISAHRQRVADLHEHAIKAELEMQKLIGAEVDHD